MHMGNELLSIPVAAGCGVISATGIAVASVRAKKTLDERRVPLLGVLGAFVFAAQMVNFPVLPGTTGHFVGGALLAILLGPDAAVLAMAAILIVQCLVFQDGGLLALGANILNMGVFGSYVGYALYRAMVGRRERLTPVRLYGAAFLASMGAVVGGATLVPIEVGLSGVSQIPFHVFFGAMVGVHVLIGTGEGLITFAALLALGRLRPDLVPGRVAANEGLPVKTAIASILAAALVVGGLFSLAAATSPDGLESTVAHQHVLAGHPEPGATEETPAEAADRLSSRIALFPDYNRPDQRWYWTSVSGVLGLLLVFGLVYLFGRLLRAPAPRTPSHRTT